MKVRGYFMLYVSLRCNNLWYIWNSEIFYADNVTKRQGQHHRLCRRVYIYYLRYRRTLGNKFRQNGGRNSVFSVNKEESHINNILTSSKSIFVCICLCIYWHTKWQWFATYSINIFAYIFWVWTMSNIQIYIIVTMIALNTKRYVYHSCGRNVPLVGWNRSICWYCDFFFTWTQISWSRTTYLRVVC